MLDKGAAVVSNDGRPSDGGRPSDDASERQDGAVFAPRSVRAPGGRSWIGAVAVLVGVGSLVLTGLLQSPAPAEPPPVPSTAAPVALATAPTIGALRSKRFAEGPFATPRGVAGPESIVAAEIRPDGRYVFVHGEVFSERVARVVVSLRNRLGRTVDTRGVSLPGGSTAFRIGAVDRFVVQLARPTPRIAATMTVRIVCFDESGARIGAVSVPATGDAA